MRPPVPTTGLEGFSKGETGGGALLLPDSDPARTVAILHDTSNTVEYDRTSLTRGITATRRYASHAEWSREFCRCDLATSIASPAKERI